MHQEMRYISRARILCLLKFISCNLNTFQVQRVMSMHNFSSTLPFIPSSTSILTAPAGAPASPAVAPVAAPVRTPSVIAGAPGEPSRQLQWQQQPSFSVQQQHRKIPTRTSVDPTAGEGAPSPPAGVNYGGQQLVSVPIRHWWMAVYHHHGDQHSSASDLSLRLPAGAVRVKRLLDSAESRSTFHQCLQEDLLDPLEDILTVKGESSWEDRVCATRTLDDRVRVLLEALPCPAHRVCQILSPEVLRPVSYTHLTLPTILLV